MKALLLILLRAYKLGISPFLGQNCRFYPSCSDYAADAIRQHGVVRGGVLATNRLCNCHPWHPGGLDPVPAKSSETSFATSSASAPGRSNP
jgi:putative membrane protein insertion efficiency factor